MKAIRRHCLLATSLLLLPALSCRDAPEASTVTPGDGVAVDGGSASDRTPTDEGLARALEDATDGIDSSDVAAHLKAHWRFHLESGPTWATQLGVHDFDDQLASTSREAADARRARRDALLLDAKRMLDGNLSDSDRTNLQLFVEEQEAEQAVDVCEYASWSFSARQNPVTTMNYFAEQHPTRDARDLERLLSRYRQVSKNIDHQVTNLRAGLEAGRVGNAESVSRVLAMVRRQLDQPTEEWPLLQPAADFPDQKAKIRTEIEEVLRPALGRYGEFLEEELLPKARPDDKVGLVHLDMGQACYAALIRKYTTLERTPDEIHQTGLAEMKRINAEMRTLGKKLFGTRDLAKILDRLRTDPELYFETEEQVEEFAADALAAAKAEMPNWFGRLPKADCGVERIPDYEAPYTTIAYYREPHADGSKPGAYFINVYEPKTRPRYEAMVLALHESIPGHHLQIAIAQELEGIPAFRKHGGRTVFVEGWALYTERLGDEMGLYKDDLDRMGVLSFDAWRAGRLVVDTGIHAKGWSRAKAEKYLLEHSALAANNIDNEVDRYISWPGQALAYKTGQLEILALRAKAEKALGSKFDISGFHDVVLGGGAVTVAELRRRVDRWITSTGETAGSKAP